MTLIKKKKKHLFITTCTLLLMHSFPLHIHVLLCNASFCVNISLWSSLCLDVEVVTVNYVKMSNILLSTKH